MANQEHSTIVNADCHEPKHITDATTGDTGKVITAHSSNNGQSEFRNLVETEIDDVYDVLTAELDDISTASSTWVVSPFAGDIDEVWTVLHGSIATSDATITPKIGGTAMTGGGITVAQSGSAAGDVDSSTPSANNTVSAGGAIEIATDGASTNTVRLTISMKLKRS